MINQALMIFSSGFQVVHCYFLCFCVFSLMSAARSKITYLNKKNATRSWLPRVFLYEYRIPVTIRTGSREQMRDVYVGTQQLLEHWT